MIGGVVNGGENVREIDATKSLGGRIEIMGDGLVEGIAIGVEEFERLSRVDDDGFDERSSWLEEHKGFGRRWISTRPVTTLEPLSDEGCSTSNKTSRAGSAFLDGSSLLGLGNIAPDTTIRSGGGCVTSGAKKTLSGGKHFGLDAVVISGSAGGGGIDGVRVEDQGGGCPQSNDVARTTERGEVRIATAGGGSAGETGGKTEDLLESRARSSTTSRGTEDDIVVGRDITNGAILDVLSLGKGINVLDVLGEGEGLMSIEGTANTDGVLGRSSASDTARTIESEVTNGEDGREVVVVVNKVIELTILRAVISLGSSLGDGGSPREQTDAGLSISMVHEAEEILFDGVGGNVEGQLAILEDVHHNELGIGSETVEHGVARDIRSRGATTGNTGCNTGAERAMTSVINGITEIGDVGNDLAEAGVDVINGDCGGGVLEKTVVNIETTVSESDDLTVTGERGNRERVWAGTSGDGTVAVKVSIGDNVGAPLGVGGVKRSGLKETDSLGALLQDPQDHLLLFGLVVDCQGDKLRTFSDVTP